MKDDKNGAIIRKVIPLFSGAAIACSAVFLTTMSLPNGAYAAIALDDAGKVKAFGDVRFRAERDDKTPQGATSSTFRTRLRYRARTGASFQPNDMWSGRFRLATTSNQNSPHVTFSTVGKTADLDIGVDQAFITFHGIEDIPVLNDISVSAGKVPLNFWHQTEVFWDEDINPEALEISYQHGPVTLNGAYSDLTDRKFDTSPENATAVFYQAVFSNSVSDVHYTVAAGGASLDDNDKVLLKTAKGGKKNIPLMADNHWIVSGQVRYGPFLGGFDYLQSNADVEDTAWVVQGRWKINKIVGVRAYFYSVETFATPGDGLFTQDNFGSAESSADNFDGWRLQLDLKAAKNTSIDVRYYNANILAKGLDGQAEEFRRVQANFNVKF